MLTWSSSGYLTAQIILPVYNTGGAFISLQEYESRFTIKDATGAIIETDSFDAGGPKVVAPTGTAYLVGEVFGDEFNADDFVTVEADGYFETLEGAPTSILAAENVSIRTSSFDGVEVLGEIANLGNERVDNADVVAIFFNAAGDVIGYARGFAENIEAGSSRAFEIDSSFAEIRVGDVAETKVYASAWDF